MKIKINNTKRDSVCVHNKIKFSCETLYLGVNYQQRKKSVGEKAEKCSLVNLYCSVLTLSIKRVIDGTKAAIAYLRSPQCE